MKTPGEAARAELEDHAGEAAACVRRAYDLGRDAATARAEKAERERDEARASLRDRDFSILDVVNERNEARADLAAMRPVVEAAVGWHGAVTEAADDATGKALVFAINDYLAARDAKTTEDLVGCTRCGYRGPGADLACHAHPAKPAAGSVDSLPVPHPIRLTAPATITVDPEAVHARTAELARLVAALPDADVFTKVWTDDGIPIGLMAKTVATLIRIERARGGR